MRVGNIVWLSGTTGTDDNRTITAPDDIVKQTRQIFRKLEALPNAVGGSREDIVQTSDFFVTTANYKATAAVRREFLKGAIPASTGERWNRAISWLRMRLPVSSRRRTSSKAKPRSSMGRNPPRSRRRPVLFPGGRIHSIRVTSARMKVLIIYAPCRIAGQGGA